MPEKRQAVLDLTCDQCRGEGVYPLDIDGDAAIVCKACGAPFGAAALQRIREALQRRQEVLPRFRRNLRALGEGRGGKP